MFLPDWLILRILHQSFDIERPKGHWSEVVVHLYIIRCFTASDSFTATHEEITFSCKIMLQAIWEGSLAGCH